MSSNTSWTMLLKSFFWSKTNLEKGNMAQFVYLYNLYVIVLKIDHLLLRNASKFQYISNCLNRIQKQWKFSLETMTLKTFESHAGLWETVEKLITWKSIGPMLLIIFNTQLNLHNRVRFKTFIFCWTEIGALKRNKNCIISLKVK